MMVEQFYTILTSIGKAKIANANVLGNKINLTTIAVGDGNGKYYNPVETQETLVNEVWKGNIQNISIDEDNPNWIIAEAIIPSNAGGFMIREVGLFNEENELLVIAKYPETYKPIVSNGATKDLRIRLILEVSNAANVTLKINPAVIFATKEDIKNVEKQIVSNLEEFKTKNTQEIEEFKNNTKATLEENKKDTDSKITNLERKTTQEIKDFKQEVTSQYEDIKNQIPKEYVTNVNGKTGEVVLDLKDFKPNISDITQIYVDGINGKDTNKGGEYSPFKTIDRAVIEARHRSLYYSDCEMTINLKSDIKTTEGRKLTNFVGTLNLDGHTMEEIAVFNSHITIMRGTVQNNFYGSNSHIKLDRVNVKGEKVDLGSVVNLVKCSIDLHNLSIDAIEQVPIGLEISNCYIYDSIEITVNNAEVGAKYSESLGINAKIFKAQKCDVEQKKERCYFV